MFKKQFSVKRAKNSYNNLAAMCLVSLFCSWEHINFNLRGCIQ